MQWKRSTSPAPKKAKVVPLAGKVMASVFWDAKDIVFIDYLQKDKTINEEYYANLLRQLRKATLDETMAQAAADGHLNIHS